MERPLAIALGLLLAGCQTVESQRQPVAATVEPVLGHPVEAWEVVISEGERVGLVVRFEASRSSAAHFMVRNIWHQDLGLIDANGRAYRYLPHTTEPIWVGTGTVLEGVARILDHGACRLFEIQFRETTAARTPGELEQRRAPSEGPDWAGT